MELHSPLRPGAQFWRKVAEKWQGDLAAVEETGCLASPSEQRF
ncbi:MAG: hypothetical protein ACI9R3_005930 [Verrucomicrobiales bacterium]|jgi:hypothetical protein